MMAPALYVSRYRKESNKKNSLQQKYYFDQTIDKNIYKNYCEFDETEKKLDNFSPRELNYYWKDVSRGLWYFRSKLHIRGDSLFLIMF